MNTIIEEIRKRIKARMDNTDAAGDYDEYADGQGVGLAAALRIIDEVEKEHPVPSDVQEAAHKTYPVDMLGDVHHPRLMIDRNQTKRESFIEGMLAERERLASCPAIKGWVARDKDGKLYLFDEMPMRLISIWQAPCFLSKIDPALFPDLRWEDEPREVEIIIKKEK